MLTFLLVVHALVTAVLVGVILMQRSEGGGLGMGGSPTGLMSARGAADFLTRTTTILATLFVLLAIASAVVASRSSIPGKIDTSLQRTPAAGGDIAPAPAPGSDPLSAIAGQVGNGSAPGIVPPPTSGPAPLPAPKTGSGDAAAVTKAPAPKATPRETTPAPAPTPKVVPTTLPVIPPKAAPDAPPAGPPANGN